MSIRTIAKHEPEPERVYVPCAHDGCFANAVTFRMIGNARVNLCREHDEKAHMAEVKRFLAERNLVTSADKAKYRKSCSMAKPGTDWAQQHIEAYEAGKGTLLTLKMACEVAGVDPEYFTQKKDAA